MTREELYFKVLSFINDNRSIKDIKDFDSMIEEGFEKEEINKILHDLQKNGYISGLTFCSGNIYIHSLILKAKGIIFIKEQKGEIHVHQINNSGTIGVIGNNNYGSTIIHNKNDMDDLVNKIINELKQSNISNKDILIEELQTNNDLQNKQVLKSTLGKILSAGSEIATISQLILSCLQYLNS